ncbi:MAG TPA: NRDE family protein [Longimicrobiaceae bacterium]|nr:NRDE family protein [Longimicrobiaceae bacterium]
MCLILFAHRAHAEYALVVAANRDEMYDRPTAAAAFWRDAPDLLAGRDLREGGTWMGITRGGRFAAVTNYREVPLSRDGKRSRGHLVAGFLRGGQAPEPYAADLAARGDEYNGFNLLVGDVTGLAYASNRGRGARLLAPGIYGLSNALLDDPWPKVVRGKAALADALAGPEDALEARLFAALADRGIAPDEALPTTGVGIERERALSASFIATPVYGTRCSTVLIVRHDGRATFTERRVGATGDAADESRFTLRLAAPSPTS